MKILWAPSRRALRHRALGFGILFTAEYAGQYTPFSEFVASTANHASEAISMPPMGREGRRRAGGLDLSESCAVGGVGRMVGGFHAQLWTRGWTT